LEEESLSEKRRKILRKGDWVSIGFQRPPQLDFVGPKSQYEIGRRRRVTDGHQAQYNRSRKLHWHFPELETSRPRPLPSDEVEERITRRFGRPDVKISIGGRVVPPGISSSSVSSKRASRSSARPQSYRPPSKSSDIMLLDYQGVSSNKISSHSQSITSQQRQEVRETQEPRFSSSSASLQHPIPQSSKVSSLLRSASSNIAESLIAHVGRHQPVVPSSQILDNEVWETWMDSVFPADDLLDTRDVISGGPIGAYPRRISPGVSAAPTYNFVTEKAECSSNSTSEYDTFSGESHQLEQLELEEEDGEQDTGSDIFDDPKADWEYSKTSDQYEESPSESPLISSPLPPMSFKVLSPIAELNRINSEEEHESMGSSSIDQIYESTNSSKHVSQRVRSRIESETGISVRPHKSSIIGDVPNASGVAADNSLHPHTIEEYPGDEIWKKIVFGSDSEEVDIFVNGTLESDAPRFVEQSLRPRQPMSDSMLSFVDNFPIMSTNNFIPSSTSRQPSVSDFRSQLVRDGSYDTSRTEIGFSVPTIEIDYHSTAGNEDSLDASSVYFQSSGSPCNTNN
jgi:hypothetical protein